MPEKITVILVDDHNVVRKGLRTAIEASDIEVIAEASSAEEALQQLKFQEPKVLVTDISLPGMGGLELVDKVSKDHPKVHTLVLSMHKEDEYILRAFEVGALGYLPKDTTEDELSHAIRIIE